ncbi:hypothetical protein WJM97_22190 [Okeanomitos corallinicola TIOX110]|uniref:Uncharacterized protein n=1 Tax=Okeanomitos corallinicola TIOX110 TaxID=3133117 RepID=A0ABZ2UT53_9CYAN
MSAKLKFVLISVFSVFTAVAAVYIIQHQPALLMTRNANSQQQAISLKNNSSDSSQFVAYPERSQYKTIPLESINSILQGSDPGTLALNILYDLKSVEGKPSVEVTFPQSNHALVMITKVKQVTDNSVNTMKYRVEMNRFGRSLLVSSPPVWQITWAGYQVQCTTQSPAQNQFSHNCN